MLSKCCNRKSLLKVFTLFFLLNLVSANIIQDLPDNMVAGSEYEAIFTFNSNTNSIYDIIIVFENVDFNAEARELTVKHGLSLD